MKDAIRVHKVKMNKDGKITINYSQPHKSGSRDEYSLTCNDAPRPAFIDALAAMGRHVVDICELPADYSGGLHVNGVTFSYGGDEETMGATITASKQLTGSTAPLLINTPHKPSEPYATGADDGNCLSDDAIADLLALQREAVAYIEGKRAQQILNLAA